MATIKDVAQRSGLSLATVSKYINGIPIKKQNEEKIEDAIRELGYVANEMARGLRTGQSNTIGVVIPELSSAFATAILSYVDDILFENGYSLIVGDCRSDKEREARTIQALLNRQVDGIINMPSDLEGKHLLPAVERNIPVVLIDRMVPTLAGSVNAVLVDNLTASKEATQLLIDAGHRDIAIVVGPQHVPPFWQRLQGYKQALKENNMPIRDSLIKIAVRSNTQMGYENTLALFANHRPTALFASNHYMTLGAVMALRDLRLEIPQDLSLMGYDDLPATRIIKPSLALVAQPLKAIAQNIAHITLAAIEGKRKNKTPEAVVKLLPAEVRGGESVVRV